MLTTVASEASVAMSLVSRTSQCSGRLKDPQFFFMSMSLTQVEPDQYPLGIRQIANHSFQGSGEPAYQGGNGNDLVSRRQPGCFQ